MGFAVRGWGSCFHSLTLSLSLTHFFHINDVKSLSSPSRLIENENRRRMEQEGEKWKTTNSKYNANDGKVHWDERHREITRKSNQNH